LADLKKPNSSKTCSYSNKGMKVKGAAMKSFLSSCLFFRKRLVDL